MEYSFTCTPSRLSSLTALASTLTLKPRMTASEEEASRTSDSEMGPAEAFRKTHSTLSDWMSRTAFLMASTEPCTSPFRSILSWAFWVPSPIMASSSSMRALRGWARRCLRSSSWRSSPSFLAARSFSISTSSSPTFGVSEKPVISTGMPGPTFLTRSPWSLTRARTLPA